jgi:hypothetical protein
MLSRLRRIVIDDFHNADEGYLDDFSVSAFNLNTRLSQRLSRFQTLHGAANTRALVGNNLYVLFAVEQLQSRQSFSYFQLFPRLPDVPHLGPRFSWGAGRSLSAQ